MSTQLWLLRHGDAEAHGAGSDAQRRLTPRGEQQARAAGVALAALGLRFEAVFTSPKVRAVETARLACEVLGGQPVEHQPLYDGFDAADARALLSVAGTDGKLLVVGHNPDLSELVGELTGARIALGKGAVAGLRIEGGRAHLLALLGSRPLALIKPG